MLVSADSVMEAQRYDEEERFFITTLILAAEAFLENAGAMRRKNRLTPAVIHLIVGFWLENRESEYTDYKDPEDFPIGMRGLITQLQYVASDDELPDVEHLPEYEETFVKEPEGDAVG